MHVDVLFVLKHKHEFHELHKYACKVKLKLLFCLLKTPVNERPATDLKVERSHEGLDETKVKTVVEQMSPLVSLHTLKLTTQAHILNTIHAYNYTDELHAYTYMYIHDSLNTFYIVLSLFCKW